jgi:hypothetical protein
MAIWYILWSFGIISPVLVCCTKKNLATPIGTEKNETKQRNGDITETDGSIWKKA